MTTEWQYTRDELAEMALKPNDTELHRRLVNAVHDVFGSMRTTHVTDYAPELAVLFERVHTAYVDDLIQAVTDAQQYASIPPVGEMGPACIGPRCWQGFPSGHVDECPRKEYIASGQYQIDAERARTSGE